MRLFAAVELDATTRQGLSRLQHALGDGLGAAGQAARLRPVAAESLHLTLRFFGDTPDAALAPLAAALEAAAADAQPCTTALARVEYWPPRAPRVIAAVFDTPRELAALAADIEARTRALGWPPERRRFRAHATLARAAGLSLPRIALALPPLVLPVTGFALLRSETLPGGARYTPLQRFALPAQPRP